MNSIKKKNIDNDDEHDTTIDINEDKHSDIDNSVNFDSKFDILLLNNGWNDKNERLIANIGENCDIYKRIHDESSSKYQFNNKMVSIIIIFFNAGLSVQTTFSNNMENVTLNIIQKIFIYIVTIISVINNFLKYEELTTNHKHAAVSFSELYHNIQTTMCMYRKDRQNAVKYISNILKKYDSLILSSPNIIQNTKDKNKQIMYDTINKLQKIDVITEPNQNLSQLKQTNLIQMNELYKIEGDLNESDITIKDLNNPKIKAMKNRQIYELNRLFGED